MHLSPASCNLIEQKLALIRSEGDTTLCWEYRGIEALDSFMRVISDACYAVRSELAYNVGVQKMPARKSPERTKPATIDDIFGSL